MNDLYMAREGVQYGPFGLDKVRELIEQRQLVGTDLVWRPGMPSWQLASEVLAELLLKPAPTPPAVPIISPSAATETSTAAAAQAISPVATPVVAPSSYQLPAYSPDAVNGQAQAEPANQADSWLAKLPNGKPLSQTWIRRFQTVEKAFGPRMSRAQGFGFWQKCLLYTGLKGAGINILAGVFGPVYYLIKGMWRQAIARTLLLIVVNQALLFLFGLDPSRDPAFAQSLGFGLQFLLYAGAANLHYYRKVVLGDKSWW